ARYYLETVFGAGRDRAAAVLRAAVGDPDCLPALRTLLQRNVVAVVAKALDGPEAALRAQLIGAQMVGLFLFRDLVGVQPLASASVDAIVAAVAPSLDGLLGR
ncbi:MAG TPA: hypothetical protein VEY30_04495, partial [Myxococcaceae bacterium]|nr:hypothetical protein [Myxococcaceae bacterium]